MNDDEILAVANEILIPAGVLGAKVRPIAGGEYKAVTIPAQGGKEPYHFGWRIHPETIPASPMRWAIVDGAKSAVAHYKAMGG